MHSLIDLRCLTSEIYLEDMEDKWTTRMTGMSIEYPLYNQTTLQLARTSAGLIPETTVGIRPFTTAQAYPSPRQFYDIG